MSNQNIYDCGLLLKQLRTARNKTQKQAATEMGIAQSTLAGYEMNTKTMSLSTLNVVSRYYGVTTDYLLGLKSDDTLVLDNLQEPDADMVRKLYDHFQNSK